MSCNGASFQCYFWENPYDGVRNGKASSWVLLEGSQVASTREREYIISQLLPPWVNVTQRTNAGTAAAAAMVGFGEASRIQKVQLWG